MNKITGKTQKTVKSVVALALVLIMFLGMVPGGTFTNVNAASSIIHIYQKGDASYLGPVFPVRVFDMDGKTYAAYSLSTNQSTVGSEFDVSLHHSEQDNYGYAYILSHGLISDDTWLGDSSLDSKSFLVKYYATQAAISAYGGQVSTKWSKDPEGIGDSVNNVVSNALIAKGEKDIVDSPACSVSILYASDGSNAENHDLYESDGYFRTQTLRLTGEGKFSVTLSATVDNKIENVTSKFTRVGDVNGDFYYRIKATELTDVINVKLTATSTSSVPYYYGEYYIDADGLQPMLIPKETQRTVTATDSIIVKCDTINIIINKTSETVNSTTGASTYPKTSGIKFKVTGPETYIVTTDKNGQAVLSDIPYGTYTITEMNLDSYYVTPSIDKVYGTPGKSYTVNVQNKLRRGLGRAQVSIEPEKYADYESRAGFTFRLTGVSDSGHAYNLTAVTKADGIARFVDETGSPDLLIGTYTITEVLSENQQRFYVKANDQTIVVKEGQTTTKDFVNVVKEGGLTIQKTSEDGFVENVKFCLYGESLAYKETGFDIYKYVRPNTVETTDASGIAVFTDILIGTYTVEEIYPDEGRKQYKYIKPDNAIAEIGWDSNTEIGIYNKLKRGNLTVKVWSEDGVLQGHRFRLQGTSFAKIPVDEVAYTDANGYVYFKNILMSGDAGDDNFYTLTQENVPERYYTQGYIVNNLSDEVTLVKNEIVNPIKVQITFNDAERKSETTNVEYFNLLKRGDIRVVLRAEDNLVVGRQYKLTFTSLAYEQTGKDKINGGTVTDVTMDSAAQYRSGSLQSKDGTEILKGTYTMTTAQDSVTETTVVDGVKWKTAEVVFKDIPISGTTGYVIEEIATPSRYIAPYSQTVSVRFTDVQKIEFLDELKRGSLEITKTSEDGFIEGFTFQLTGTSFAYRQGGADTTVYGEKLNNFTYTATTNKDGIARFENLPITWDGKNTADLATGKYKVEEINTPSRYIQTLSQTTYIVWNDARLYNEGGPGPGSAGRWKNKSTLGFYNQLKRGNLEVNITTEDGFLEGFKFRLTGTCFASRQTSENKESQTGKLILPSGAENTIQDSAELYTIDFTKSTDANGKIVFEDILISHDAATADATWYYTITPVETPRRYEIAVDQKAPIYWRSSSSVIPESRTFYDRLKRGRIIIQKVAETIDTETMKPTTNGANLAGYHFKITVKSLAAIESGTTQPPAYYGQYGKDASGNLTSSAVANSAYETVYEAYTDPDGRAIFNDILINDYYYSDIGNYIDYTHDLIELPENASKQYYYEVEEIYLSNEFVQPAKQYVNVKWYNDMHNSNKADLTFTNKLKTFRVVVEKQDKETGNIPQGDAKLGGAKFGFYYNGRLLKDYMTESAEDLLAADPTLAGYVLPGHYYFVTDYYACADGYAAREDTAPEGYLPETADPAVISFSANANRFKTTDRYNTSVEKIENTIIGPTGVEGSDSNRYISKSQVLKKTITLVKFVRPGDVYEGLNEYCVEFRVYLLSKEFKWTPTSNTPEQLTYSDPLLQDHDNPREYDMQDPAVVEKIEQEQTDVRTDVRNYSTEQDYLITNVNGIRKSLELPYGHYVVEQITSWNSYEVAKAVYIQLTEDDPDNDNNVYLYIKNDIDAQYLRVVKLDREISPARWPKEDDRTAALSGATYKLYDTILKDYVPIYENLVTGEKRYTFTTNEYGIATTEKKIEAGIYQIHEIDAATGFARAKYELGDYETIAIGYDARCFDENGRLLNAVTVYFTNDPQKNIIHLRDEGERLQSISQSTSGGTTTYGFNYLSQGLKGGTYEIYAVESPTAFDDIPSDMVNYAKPITAYNSTQADKCYPRYYDRFGIALVTNEEPVDVITTDANGDAYSMELYNGLYRIVQTKAPEGMLLDTEAKYVYLNNLDEENRCVTKNVTYYNNRQKVHVTVDKSMEQIEKYNIGYSGEVAQVKFGIYAARSITAVNGNKVPQGGLLATVTMSVTDIAKGLGSGTFDVDLPQGSYLIKEIGTHIAYVIDDRPHYVDFDYYQNAIVGTSYESNGIEYTVDNSGYIVVKPTNPDNPERDTTLTNTAKRGTISGYKVQQGNTNIKINYALFGLFKPTETNFVLENALEYCYTGYAGKAGYFEFANIPYGTWIVKELTPPEGYLLTNMATQTPSIETNGQKVSYNIENRLILGSIELMLYDKTDGKPIIDYTSDKATFTLYEDVNKSGKFEAGIDRVYRDDSVLITNSAGKLIIENVPYGDYVLIQSTAPNGYLRDTGYYAIKIREDGKTIAITNTSDSIFESSGGIVFLNERQTGRMTLTLTAEMLTDILLDDGTTGLVHDVDNIMFTIISKANENPFNKEFTFTAKTDVNGVAKFANVFVGEYTVIQVQTNANKIYNIRDNEGTVQIEYNKDAEFYVHDIPYINTLKIVKDAPDGGDISDVIFKITGIINENNYYEKYITINPNIVNYGQYGVTSTTSINLVVGNYSVEEIINTDLFVQPEEESAVLADKTMTYEESLAMISSTNPTYPKTTVTIINYLKILADLVISVKGEEDDSFATNVYTDDTAEYKPLSNVKLLVYGDPNSDYEDVQNFSSYVTTGNDGTVKLIRLHVGDYFVKELHPNTYKLNFTGKYEMADEILERIFEDHLSPYTEGENAIKARLREALQNQGAEDIEGIIADIISTMNKMIINENNSLKVSTDNYDFTLTSVGAKGNIGYVNDNETKTIEVKYQFDRSPNILPTIYNKLETSNIEIYKTSEDDYVDGVEFYVEGYSKTGIHCSFTFDADKLDKQYDPELGKMVNVAFINERLLSGKYTVTELSKTQYNLSAIDEENDLDESGKIKPEISKIPVDITDSKSIYYAPVISQDTTLGYSYINEDTTGRVYFKNMLKKGDLIITKTAEDREAGRLAGFMFRVTALLANGNTYEEYFTTDPNGSIVIKDLVVGNYKIEELTQDQYGNALTIMEPYILPDAQNTEIMLGYTSEVSFNNELERGPLEIIKTSEDGKVQGVKFRVEGYQKNGEWFEGIFETDEDGRVYTDIIAGEYTVTELFDEKSPYKKCDPVSVVVDKYGYAQVTVDDDDNDTDAATSTDATPTDAEEINRVARFNNEFAYGSIMLTLSSDGEIAGFSFKLSGVAYNGQAINMTLLTDEHGIVRFVHIPVGEYKIEELKTAITVPYVLPSSQKVEVIEDENIDVQFKNRYIRSTIKTVLTGSDKAKLANGVFTIYGSDKVTAVGTIRTTGDGTGPITELIYGTYYIRQTTAPSGYQLNKNCYKITVSKDGAVFTISCIDRKDSDIKHDKVPYTGDFDLIETSTETKTDEAEVLTAADDDAPVQTGDTTDYSLTVMLMITSLCLVFALSFKRKRNAE